VADRSPLDLSSHEKLIQETQAMMGFLSATPQNTARGEAGQTASEICAKLLADKVCDGV
jgi:hypothetical protein